MATKKLPTFAVGDKVQLDAQPFEWQVIETAVNGLPQAVKIKRECHPDELFKAVVRDVDVMRLKKLPAPKAGA